MKLPIINIFASHTGILPGDLTDCRHPTDTTDPSCVGGLASVASVMRYSKNRGDGPSFHFPALDRESKFVQMHSEGWAVNRIVAHDYFGWDSFLAPPSIFTDENRLESISLLTRSFRPTMTNVDLPPTSKWAEYLEHIYIDEETGASFIFIDSDSQPRTTPSVESMIAALDHIANANANSGCNERQGDSLTSNIYSLFEQTEATDESIIFCLIPIVHIVDNDEKLTEACLQAALQHPSPPFIFTDVSGIRVTPEVVNGQTLVATIEDRGDILTHLHVEIDQSERVVKNYTMNTIDLGNLPDEYKDDTYIKDMVYLRTLADEALANDPVVGTSGFMPMTRTIARSDWRMCMGGECPIGNLFTDALRWAGHADFAALNSGGVRGEGWLAGEVRVSDLWAALPFVNHICTGVLSGVSVFKLLNYSTSVATFLSTKTEMGDRLLQLSGMKMTYNTLLKGSGSGRLISVDVWDREKEEYLPLERLKMYKFASDNWMCDHFDRYPSLFNPELIMEGEIPGTVDESRPVQDIVGAYLTSLNAKYDTSLRGSHINDTQAFGPMSFIQTAESCLLDQYWQGKQQTCRPCPGGKHVKFSEDLITFLITPDSGELTGRNVLSNKELFNVTLAPKLVPGWVVLEEKERSIVLGPGESIAVDIGIDVSTLGKGTFQSTVSFGMNLDGDYRGCLANLDISFDTVVTVQSEENFNHLGAFRSVGLTLMALAMALSIFFSVWTHRNRKNRIVKLSQPVFLHIICGGVMIMAATIIPLSIDDDIASIRGCDIACMATPWLFSMGFTITFSALFAKIWRVHKVISNAKHMRRVEVHERQALKPIVIMLTLNVLLLLCWTLIDPVKWQRETGDPANSYGFCKSEGMASIAFLILLMLLNGAALLVACVQAYKARKLDDEFTETRWLAIACASWIQALIVGVPVIILTRNQPTASYFTVSALVFLVCVSMLLLMFVPKMKSMNKIEVNDVIRSSALRSTTGFQTSTLRSTLNSNAEELKRQIHELESRNHELESILHRGRHHRGYDCNNDRLVQFEKDENGDDDKDDVTQKKDVEKAVEVINSESEEIDVTANSANKMKKRPMPGDSYNSFLGFLSHKSSNPAKETHTQPYPGNTLTRQIYEPSVLQGGRHHRGYGG